MKKMVLVLLVLSMIMAYSFALAENMGVQVIGGPVEEAEPVSLDDVKLNVDIEIDRYGILTPKTFFFDDYFAVFTSTNQNSDNRENYNSGAEADFACFYMDIINTTTKAKNYLESCQVKVVYDDVYEYGGWSYQINYNRPHWNDRDRPNYSGKQNQTYGNNESLKFAIDPMYQGHYVFGCTLPNAVINSKKPLRMVITIDGNEITYNIRK